MVPHVNDDLASRLESVLRSRPYMGNKRAAYRDAGVSPQTFDRALSGLPIRADKQAEIEEFIAQHGRPALDPEPGTARIFYVTPEELDAVRDELLERIERLERREAGEDRDDTAPIGDRSAMPEGAIEDHTDTPGGGEVVDLPREGPEKLPTTAPARRAARRGRKQATDEPGDGA